MFQVTAHRRFAAVVHPAELLRQHHPRPARYFPANSISEMVPESPIWDSHEVSGNAQAVFPGRSSSLEKPGTAQQEPVVSSPARPTRTSLDSSPAAPEAGNEGDQPSLASLFSASRSSSLQQAEPPTSQAAPVPSTETRQRDVGAAAIPFARQPDPAPAPQSPKKEAPLPVKPPEPKPAEPVVPDAPQAAKLAVDRSPAASEPKESSPVREQPGKVNTADAIAEAIKAASAATAAPGDTRHTKQHVFSMAWLSRSTRGHAACGRSHNSECLKYKVVSLSLGSGLLCLRFQCWCRGDG